MSYIRNEDYSKERVRPKLFHNYLETMKRYLKSLHPGESDETIDTFVKNIIRTRAKSPRVEAMIHEREGYSKHVDMPLDKYIVEVIGANNLSPSGSCYHPVSVKESFLRISIEEKVKARNDFKKLYLNYEAQGQKRESQYYYQNQANAKIFNNAIAGGMKIKQFIFGSKSGFNAITSAGRMSVKQGYSIIERAVVGNIYLPNLPATLSYIFNHVRHIPEGFTELITSGTLYQPTVPDVVGFLVRSMKNYTANIDTLKLTQVLKSLTPVELSYVFYAGCFDNLCRFNEDLMKSWIDSCFCPEYLEPDLYQDIDIAEVKTFRDDVISCVLSTNYKRLGRNPEKPDKWNSLKDAVIYNPEGLKQFIYACRHFIKAFEVFVPILRPIMHIETTFSKLTFQHRMARYTVPLSDTDSNIFSNQELIKWKLGQVDFSQKAYEMNGLTTFILSQSLEHVFGRLASGFGVEGKDVFRISMKNEFLFPILMVTSLSKHYLAIATMQEGSLLPNPRKEIKGVGFRSSAYPRIIRDGFEKYVVNLFGQIEEKGKIKAAGVLGHVAQTEREIFRSISESESVYLQTVSVKRREDYTEPLTSPYFYYELWQEVFAPDYGEMTIPNKCYKIPIRGGNKLFKDEAFMTQFAQVSPGAHERMIAFLERYPKRALTHILIPPFKGKTQVIFMMMMDVRSHITKSMTPYYHLLDTLGIATIDRRADALVSDFYDPSQSVIS